ncbi:hypothetical protein PDESU_01720 [Pontiella desulfatans]|uniref:HTH lacI-type domain-containing protein n=1 Tax=Pontiella desulfatans TaxID=2750659 RepID=A0A6C2U1B0_PONDE|nr:LacI family DNA-binding transcriptional regulator [Pontiella desulfatans]VGO13166.1 hypothetical protein PDESU_01720 [Pontiella desulfatans]
MSKNNPERRVTHADIAREVGVSKATVSLSLSNHPRISDAMKMRVRKKAEEMGYDPDPMLSALAHYRNSSQTKPTQAVLAWINPLENPDDLRGQHEFDLYWKGAFDAAHQLGYRLEEFRTKDISLQRMDSIFKTRNIRGILIAGLRHTTFLHTKTDWQSFPWKDYAAVRFGRSTAYPETHYVTSAQTANTMLAVKSIRQRGYQRIGYFGEYSEVRLFCAGFLFAQLTLPENLRLPPLLFTLEDSIHQQKEKLKIWIKQYKPDVILTEHSGIFQLLADLKIRIPDDIGLVTNSIHDTPIDAGIDQNPRDIGYAATRMLISLINGHSLGIPSVRNETLIEGSWVDGSMLPNRNIE